jgi:2-polyprenyl-3-methyl-5-hydroxy-6-metoxy-1,4-benzoquinol methylase
MKITCSFCFSDDTVVLNTYKHYCCVCNDCNNVSHQKKNKYLLDFILPKFLLRKFIPQKAFLRLFSDSRYSASEFYDVYSNELLNLNEWRKSEFEQIKDEFILGGIDYKDKTILDISGGPGALIEKLREQAKEVSITELSFEAVEAMKNAYNIDARKFDYTKDAIDEVFGEKKFDIILVRSSIIFCDNLDDFIMKLHRILNSDGYVFIETILPTYGEIFWWQQMEYKFPFIYSQETIEKLFYKNEFKLISGHRNYGSYYAVKQKSYHTIDRLFFTWFIEYPLLLLYLLPSYFKKTAIDSSLKHKVLTMIWKKGGNASNVVYFNYEQGSANQSKTFGSVYNGYLKKK